MDGFVITRSEEEEGNQICVKI